MTITGNTNMIDPTIKYLIVYDTPFLHQFGLDGFKRRNIDTKRIIEKVIELYGEKYSGEQFLEFGEKFLDSYLIEKHGITFSEILLEGFKPILHRFRHLI
jgi:hypothetical protein